jgi:predicted transcriptional regulator
MNNIVSASVSDDIYTKINSFANEVKKTRSWVISQILNEYFQKRGENNGSNNL